MPMILPFLVAALSVSAVPCADGDWIFKAGDTSLFRFGVHASPQGLKATWDRPQDFDFDKENFTNVTGPVIRRTAIKVQPVGDDLELTFDDPRPGATPDIFRLHCLADGQVSAMYQGVAFEPFLLGRAVPGKDALGPWTAGGIYRQKMDYPTNAEMSAIFKADQDDRRRPNIDWSVVGPADAKRKARTQELLDAGALHSGDDFYHAAFLFQHGDGPGDYLKAHLLAMIAAARGKPKAVWIASATLDRYLQSIGKPQVLGTQYSIPRGGAVTQEPYDKALVSDALRQALRVPSLAEQDKRRQALADQVAAEAKAQAAVSPKP